MKQGVESLKELLCYNNHGSGMLLRKSVFDFNKGIKYSKRLNMMGFEIGKAMTLGDTLCTLKIFTYIGKDRYESADRSSRPTAFHRRPLPRRPDRVCGRYSSRR